MEGDINLPKAVAVRQEDSILQKWIPYQNDYYADNNINYQGIQTLRMDDSLFQQQEFTYTRLLQGEFDTVYSETPTHASMQETGRLTEAGGCSTQKDYSFRNDANQELRDSNDFSNETWTENLFQNLEMDEGDYGQAHDESQEEENNPDNTGTTSGSTLTNQNEEAEKEICEEDIEEFLKDEESAKQGQSTTSVDEKLIPEVGKQFKTREEAQHFFNMYAYAVGFSMVIVSAARTTSRKRNREVIRVTMKCNKYGTNTPREREDITAQRQCTVINKTNCKVEMVISEKLGVWTITNLCLVHNHMLSPQSNYFRSHIYMSNEEKAMIRTLRQANITTSKIVSVLSFLRGGPQNTPYNRKKVSNYGTTVNRELKNSDVMQVVQYFKKKRSEDERFYYSFQVDANNKVKSVFWADAKSKSYYETCGDCICFDTTFLTNKYNLLFAPIVGVSPHGHTYLFACALIVNECAKTFEWVFKEFIYAMGGKHPQTIITDQDRGMESAISEVLPHTVHKCCLFHVKSKAEQKAGRTFQVNEGLFEEFQDVIDNSLTEQEFETLWQEMILNFDVAHIEYFQTMWKSRKRWAPVYFKKDFFPFLQTTARSEGTNSLFKKGVGAQYSMTSLLREYQRIMDTIHSREAECDHNAIHKKVPTDKLRTKYYFEMQANNLYNLAIFRKFQKNLTDVTRLRVKEEKPGQMYLVFQAPNYPIKEHRPRTYLVQVDLEKEEYHCICCAFEKDGLLCSHILKVMLHLDINKIPDKYIIDRWRKSYKRENPLHVPSKLADDDTLRYNALARRMVATASKGATHQRKYDYLQKEMDRIDKGLEEIEIELQEEMKKQAGETRTIANFANPSNGQEDISAIELIDPDNAHTKGRPRLMTIVEAIKAGKFYKCSHCGEFGHTIKSCVNRDKQYNLPKQKRSRKKKNNDSGTQNGADGSTAGPKTKRKTQQPTKKSKGNNSGDRQNNNEHSTMFIQDTGDLPAL